MQLYTDEYRASTDWPYAICAGCVVYRKVNGQAEILLLSRTNKTDPTSAGLNSNSYHLPKGHNEIEESLLETALREVKEEAAVEASPSIYLGALNWTFKHPRDKYNSNKTVHYFAAEWISEQGPIDEEHDSKEWVSIENAEKLLGKPNPKGEDEIIRRFKKYLELTNGKS